jgi:hypothetical protein
VTWGDGGPSKPSGCFSVYLVMSEPSTVDLYPPARLTGTCLIIAPLLFASSTFLWSDGEYGVYGGALLAVAMVFWIPAFIALFALLRRQMPRYATWALLPAWYGCISGSLFGFQGIYSAAFAITNEMERAAYAQYPLSFNLTLFWPGPLFPLSLLLLGLCLLWKRAAPLWAAALLSLSGITFPVSRILRIEWVAHLSDALLLLPALYLGWQVLRKQET